MAAGSQYEQNPRGAGEGTVPKDSLQAIVHQSTDAPQEIPTGLTIPPGKPGASTGPGGPSISIPKVGKSGA